MTTSPIRAKVPVIDTEIRGVHDLWGQTLADYWDVIWPCDGITGAFIWEWQDQGLADKFPERWSIRSPGAQPQDTATGMRPDGRRRSAHAGSPDQARAVLEPQDGL